MHATLDAIQNIFNSDLASASPGAHAAGSVPFQGFLENAAQQMDQMRSEANQKVSGLMAGNGTDLHTALIATQKADLAFELALAARNKAISAYQQLMSTQF